MEKDQPRREHGLLERELEAADRFPGQNPHPVLCIDRDGVLLYANDSSRPITSAWIVAVGDRLDDATLSGLRAAAVATPPGTIEIQHGGRTYSVLAVDVPELQVTNLYGTDITAAKAIDRFPSGNPNPVLRMSEEGTLLYANDASQPIVAALGISIGEPMPADLCDSVLAALDGPAMAPDVRANGRTYSLTPVRIPEFGFINLYGTDITARIAINKFPDQNPNPVLRVTPDGRLQYANPASALVRKALRAEVGDQIPRGWLRRILAASEAAEPQVLEATSQGRVYELLVVAVYEFGFINLYGTDVTAARAVTRAHAENERLLLNILPAAIAHRLRQGERIIADRIDDMSVLFADVVDFTPMSARLSATEVVALLNDVFSRFDRLVERFDLEKIKTVGDAYMVVGGLPPEPRGHAERMADMGLAMIEAVGSLEPIASGALAVRVGMHLGAGVAGVIGVKKFSYDVWGDTVNTASRMESHGVPSRLQVTEHTYHQLVDRFAFEPRGEIEVKGKGPVQTFLVVGRR